MALLDEGKAVRIPRDVDNRLINLEKLPVLSGLRRAGQRRRAQADHGGPKRPALAGTDGRDRSANAAFPVIIRDGFRPPGDRSSVVIQYLFGAMNCRSMRQEVIPAVSGDQDLVDAEETAN